MAVCSECVCKGHLTYSNVLPKAFEQHSFVAICALWTTEANVITAHTFSFSFIRDVDCLFMEKTSFEIWRFGSLYCTENAALLYAEQTFQFFSIF